MKCDVVEIEDVVEQDINSLYEEYLTYSRMESTAKKRKAEIKKYLSDKFMEKDFKGNYYIPTEQGSFKNMLRQKREIDPIMAEPILRRLGIFDKVVTFVPEYNLDMLTNYINDGTVNQDDLKRMFKVTNSYALCVVEGKDEEETEETQE